MDKFLIKNQKKDVSNSKTIRTNESRVEQKRPHIELDMNDIVEDPGLRKPIDESPHKIRDDAKRAYLQMCSCQPFGHTFPQTPGNFQTRSFVESWFKQFDWLE